jgi:hypothetical protein
VRNLVAVGISLLACSAIRAGDAAAPGFLEGHLKITSRETVEIAEAGGAKRPSVDYAKYPLIVLSMTKNQEVARVIADQDGNYRVALPPGDYVLDAKGRAPGHVRAKPQAFSVASNQTVHADFALDTGIR